LHDIHKPHIGAVEVSQKVDDATWEQNTEVKLADESTLLGIVPILLCCIVFDAVLTAV